MNLSAVILAKNEEQNIADCLEGVKFADEILVLDDNSTDRTADLARHLGARVVIHSLNGNFASQRNYALNLVHGKWVLFLDADERISERLSEEIKKIVTTDKNDVEGYYVRRRDIMWGKSLKHGETSKSKLLRLAKNGAGKWRGKVHEKWIIKGRTDDLNGVLKHIPHPTIYAFLEEIDRYTTLRSQELEESGAKSNSASIVLYPLGKFIMNYIIKKGYKDGVAGFLSAAMMSFHSFLVRGKLYLNKK